MDANEARNAVQDMVLTDLSAICQKLAESSTVPNDLRVRAREMVQEFKSLSVDRDKGTTAEHYWGETLLIQMARFLPRIVDVQSWPEQPQTSWPAGVTDAPEFEGKRN